MTIQKVHSFGKLVSVLIGSGMLLTACGGGGGGGGGGDDDERPAPGPDDGNGSAQVSGTIEILPGTRVDGDYADLWQASSSWPAGSRDPVTVPVPVTVGGYLSHQAGTYSNNLGYPLDATDTYAVSLQERDRYYLQCFAAEGGDDGSPNVTLSLGSTDITDACGKGGEITADDTDITLTANDGGPFRYVLSLAAPGALSVANVRWPEPPLRVNEAIVTGTDAVAGSLSASGLQASSVMSLERSIGPGTWQVRRKPAAGTLNAGNASAGDPRAETIAWIRNMREEFALDVEPNYLFQLATLSPGSNEYYPGSDAGQPDNWNLAGDHSIHMDNAWGLTGGTWGAGVGVAVMDTGMFSRTPASYSDWHEDLAASMVGNPGALLDFVSADYDVDGDPGRDGNPATPLTPNNPAGTSFHGTHVAGIIAATDNSVGTVGVAHEATIFPYRVLGVDPVDGTDGTGGLADLIASINSAAGRTDVHAINLSLGGLPRSDALQDATDRAYDAGQLVVAAGGNSGDGSAVYPAANRRVVGVGATDRSGDLAGYSNYGQSVDVMAPGGSLTDGILNAYGDYANGNLSSGYAYLAGTSMAAPHLTGVYALMKGVDENLTPDQFRAQLIAGYLSDDSFLDDYGLFGAGMLDAEKALAGPLDRYPTVVSAWPRVLEIDRTGKESEVLLEVLKADTANAPTVSGTPSVPSPFRLTDGSGNEVQLSDGQAIPENFAIRVKREELSDGRDIAGNIIVSYSAEGGTVRDLVIPVQVQAADQPAKRNAGRHYVLLLDADDYDSSRSMEVRGTYSNGQYSYTLDDVVPGNYVLVAGSDIDGNGFICENGEACAEYPSIGARQEIVLQDGDSLTLNMTTGYRRPGIAEMGLPRYGFKGYPIPAHATGSGRKQLR